MNCFPRFTVRHTNERYSGQVYLPEVNYLIMAGTLAVVVGFQNATNIGNAYGLAIIFVMLLDTSLLSLVMLLGWEWPTAVVAAFWTVFTFLSGAYLSSNLNKASATADRRPFAGHAMCRILPSASPVSLPCFVILLATILSQFRAV